MNTKLYWWIGATLLGAIIIGILTYAVLPPVEPPQSSQPTTTLPISEPSPSGFPGTSTPTAATQSGQTGTIAIRTSAGRSIEAIDFIQNGSATEDPSNNNRYLFTGSPDDGFAIVYYPTGQYFIIALEREPLGETRTAAENYLLSMLGINQAELCSLTYYLGTDVYTNSQYAAKNLGFSFCPGATVLP